MRKFLSIIIPRCKETEKDVFPLLSSIKLQAGIDFSDVEIVFANDGGSTKALSEDFLRMFEIDIRQVELEENSGPGVARQVGLDHAKGEYVFFCDADDCLHSVGVLGAMIQEAEKSAPDILSTEWLEEIIEANGQYSYITHHIENTWMHGKFFRRHFLEQNRIRFHEKLRVHEDSYFLCIAASAAQRKLHIPITSYVWKYRPNSITRRNGGSYTYESIPTFIEACTLAFSEVEKRYPVQMEYKILQFILYNYFCFHQPGWQSPENAERLAASERAFTKYMTPFMHYWINADSRRIAEIYNQERARAFPNYVEKETVEVWLKRVCGEVGAYE